MLGSGLDLYHLAAGGHNEVHIDIGAGVFFVGQVEENFAIDDTYADGGDEVAQGDRAQGAGFDELLQCEAQGDEGARDGGGAGSAVGLDDVAVDPDSPLAQFFQVRYGAQGTADETLNFVGTSGGASFAHFARRTRQSRARKHAVFARHPALAAVAEEGGDGLFDGSGADDAGVADFDERGAFGGVDEVREDGDGPDLVESTVIGTENHLRDCKSGLGCQASGSRVSGGNCHF